MPSPLGMAVSPIDQLLAFQAHGSHSLGGLRLAPHRRSAARTSTSSNRVRNDPGFIGLRVFSSLRDLSRRESVGARLIKQTLLDPSVGVDAAVAQEWPMGAVFIDALPFDIGEDGFFAVDARLSENLAARRDDEALAPELDAIATDGCSRGRRD